MLSTEIPGIFGIKQILNLPDKTTKEELELGRDHKNITEMMCELLKQHPAYELEIDISDGNPMNFHHFMGVFKKVVKNKMTDPRGWLTRLIKFTKGEAKQIAKNCIQLPSELGFKTAKGLLTKKLGDPHVIAASYRKEIQQWPQIKAGDTEANRRFQNFFVKCENIDGDGDEVDGDRKSGNHLC